MKSMGLIFALALLAVTFQGCVRLAGGAGYWHADQEKGTQSKSVGFDTNDLVPGSQAPGNIS